MKLNYFIYIVLWTFIKNVLFKMEDDWYSHLTFDTKYTIDGMAKTLESSLHFREKSTVARISNFTYFF